MLCCWLWSYLGTPLWRYFSGTSDHSLASYPTTHMFLIILLLPSLFLGESLADTSLDPFGFLGASNGFFYYPEPFKPSFKHIMTQNDRQHLAPNTTTSSTSLLRIKTSIWLIQNLITNTLTMTIISLLWMSKILFMLPCLSSLLVRLWVRLCHYKWKYLNVQCTDKLLVR